MPRQRDIEQQLANVDAEKREKWVQKYQDFAGRDWSRDTFVRDWKDVRNAIETVDDVIQDLQDDLRALEGGANRTAKIERIKQRIGEDVYTQKIRQKRIGETQYTADIHEIRQVEQERANLEKKIKEWKGLQVELGLLAARQLYAVGAGYRRDFIRSDYVENQADEVMKRVADRFELLEEKLTRKIQERLSAAELAAQQPAGQSPVAAVQQTIADQQEQEDSEEQPVPTEGRTKTEIVDDLLELREQGELDAAEWTKKKIANYANASESLVTKRMD